MTDDLFLSPTAATAIWIFLVAPRKASTEPIVRDLIETLYTFYYI